jgi:hypothetical protein
VAALPGQVRLWSRCQQAWGGVKAASQRRCCRMTPGATCNSHTACRLNQIQSVAATVLNTRLTSPLAIWNADCHNPHSAGPVLLPGRCAATIYSGQTEYMSQRCWYYYYTTMQHVSAGSMLPGFAKGT